MYSDRELLELAAKAAGYAVEPDAHIPSGGIWLAESDGDKPWNPLSDDGDAFRLAYIIRLSIPSWGGSLADCRRAIVRAAAAIGEGMK